MTPAELLAAHRAQWRAALAPRAVAERLARGMRQLRPGALMLSGAMNAFYGHKQLTGNEPARAAPSDDRIAHARVATPELVPLRTKGAAGRAA